MAERRVWIVTDAAADLPSTEILRTRYGIGPITQIPLAVSFGEDSYTVGIDIDNNLFRKLIHKTGLIPKTAALAPVAFGEAYKKLAEDGLEIVSVHVGDNLSATGNNAREAAKMFDPNRVTILNSGTVSMAQGLQVIALEREAALGASREEIIAKFKDIKRRITLRAITPNIPYLRASGRASHLTAVLADALNIKPILQVDQGVVENVGKPRTMRRALDWLIDFVRSTGTPEQVAIVDFEAEETAELLKVKLINEAHVPEERIYRGTLGPLTAGHGGPGTLGLITMNTK